MFVRLFVLSILLFVNLYACKGSYASCVAKVKDSHAVKSDRVEVPLQNATRLVYTDKKPDAKILKYDPFLSLYLVKDNKPFTYPFDINMRLQLGTAMVNDKESREGRFVRNQIGLNSLGRYSEALLVPSLLTSSCCSLEGIVTPRGIIQKEYLKHFVNSKKSLYGDIGIRTKNEKGFVIVSTSDPFFPKNPFRKGDCIVKLDGKNIKAASVLMRKILFSKVEQKHTVTVKRADHYLTFSVQTQKRFGGGVISDTFLESQGLYFDKKLTLTKVQKKFKNYGIKIGDRLLQVNGVAIKDQQELREYLQKAKKYSSFLFERNGFQFFVNIK